MAQVNEAMMSSLQNVDMLALCSSHDDRRGSGPEVPATPHFRHRDRPRYQQGRTSGSGSGSEPLSSRDAGRRYLHPTSASAAAPTASFSWTQAAAALHQRGAWERCGHGCERGDGGGTARSIAHMDDLATIGD